MCVAFLLNEKKRVKDVRKEDGNKDIEHETKVADDVRLPAKVDTKEVLQKCGSI